MEQPRRVNSTEIFDLNRRTPLSHKVIDAIREFPVVRVVDHCGTPFDVSPFDLYAACPKCGTDVKLRSFAATSEIEDVFDAVFAWLMMPEAQATCRRRQDQIKADPLNEEQ